MPIRSLVGLAFLLVLATHVSTHGGGSSSRPGGGGGGGITTLNDQTGPTQSFTATDDPNVLLEVTSSGNTHTWTMGWTGTLLKSRQHLTTVYTDQANIYSTGLQDFSAATLTLPTGGATGNITGTAGTATTATALAANGGNCSAGNAPLGVDAAGAVEGCTDVATQVEHDALNAAKQPLDPDLTTLAGKSIQGTGTDVRLSTGAFAADDCVRVDLNGNFATTGAPCGGEAGPTGVSSFNGRTGAVAPTAGDYTGTLVTNAPLGTIAATTTQNAIDELNSEKQPLDSDLTTLAGKTLVSPGTDLRFSTGAFTPNDCVEVDANGNLATAGAACGTGNMLSFEGRSGAVVGQAGDYLAAEITNSPSGNLSSPTAQAALNELDAEKQATDADLTTLAGKSIQGTGTDLRLSTGAFAANDCVKVDASGNFSTAGAACGVGSSGVTSFEGRTGVVAGVANDYTASEIANQPLNSISSTAVQAALNELEAEKQPLDADLTTLAGKTLQGTGTDLRLAAGAFAADACVKVDASGNFVTAGVSCSASGVTAGAKGDINVIDPGANWQIVTNSVGNADLLDVPSLTLKGRVTGGTGDPEDLTASQVATVLDSEVALQTELNTHAALTAAHSATATPTANRIVMSEGTGLIAGGWVPPPTDTVFGGVLTNAPCNATTGKVIGIGTDGRVVCGVDQSGGPGGSAQGLQANADIQRQITNAVDLASAVCIGGTDHKWCWHGNSTEGTVETIFPAQDMNRILAAGFDHNIKAADGTNIATFDEATKTLIVPNQIVSPGIVKHFESPTAPTITDDAGDGFAVHSEWTNTTPEPDQIWICTDATPGAAKWTQITSFTQVDKSLQDAANIGRTITNLTNEANALVLGDGTGGKKFWNDPAEGWREEVFPPGDQIYDIASTFALIIRYNDIELTRWDSTGNQTWSNQGKPTISIPWTAGSVETDGTNCATQAQANLTGFRLQDFGCVAFTTGAGQFTLHIPMRTGWDPTVAMPFTLRVRTLGPTSLVWVADVSMWCFGEDEALPTDTQFNGATPQEINITTGTTAGLRKGDTTTAISPGGNCTDNDTLAVRVRTKTGHTATAAAARVFEGLVHAKYDKLGD